MAIGGVFFLQKKAHLLEQIYIYRRVGRTAARYGIKTTTIYTDPDARSQHALSSPFSINLGDPTAYLDGERIIEAAKQKGCVGIHPGYGFVCVFSCKK